MKIAASTPAEQRRQWILLGLLAIVAIAVWYTQWSGPATEVAAPASNPTAARDIAVRARAEANREQPEGALPQPLRLHDLEPVPVQTTGARNPFGFGSRPVPPAPPPPPPPPPPAPVEAPPPGPPPLPPIPVKFLGFVEDPAHPGKVVALGVNGGVVVAREGALVDGRYRLLKIGLETIVMAYPDGRGQQIIRIGG